MVKTHEQSKHSEISEDKGKHPEERIPKGVLERVTSVLDLKRMEVEGRGLDTKEGTQGHFVFLTQRWDSGG